MEEQIADKKRRMVRIRLEGKTVEELHDELTELLFGSVKITGYGGRGITDEDIKVAEFDFKARSISQMDEFISVLRGTEYIIDIYDMIW